MGYSQQNKMAAGCVNVVGNSCVLGTESIKPLIHRDNSLRKVNLTFKHGFIVVKLKKNSAVIHLERGVNLKRQTGRQDRVT